MSNAEYTISVANAISTINELHELLSSRELRLKKSDLKEAISSLLNFDSSNELDAKIKELREKQVALSIYGKDGRHKLHRDILLKHFKSPLKAYNFFRKYNCFSTIVIFFEDFELSSGYKYEEGDILFAKSDTKAIKILLDWGKHAKIKYTPYGQDQPKEYFYDGCWSLEIEGADIEKALGEHVYLDSHCVKGSFNSPDTPIEIVTEKLVTILIQGELPFSVNDRKMFDSYLLDWIIDDYAENYSAVRNEKDYIQYIEKYLPYVGIQKIVEMETGDVPIEYLRLLNRYEAKFDNPKLMISAANSGSLETCGYLLECGNTLDAFYLRSWENSSTIYLHSEACIDTSSGLTESAKSFYTIVHQLGINIDVKDSTDNTPLHYAANCGNDGLYQHLIFLGADKESRNSEGKTPSELLEERDEKRVDLFSDVFGALFKT